jgi:hypothetical protein
VSSVVSSAARVADSGARVLESTLVRSAYRDCPSWIRLINETTTTARPIRGDRSAPGRCAAARQKVVLDAPWRCTRRCRRRVRSRALALANLETELAAILGR